MTALVKHMHAFAREVDLKPDEWLDGDPVPRRDRADLDDKRPEFILLSDTLGLSMMVVALDAGARASGGAQGRDARRPRPRSQGPFYWAGAPDLPLGADIGEGVRGEPALLHAAASPTCDGKPLAGALLDVWSGDGDGKYDVQLGGEPTMRARGRFRTDAAGPLLVLVDPARPTTRCPTTARWARCCARTGRSIYRPGHIHMMVSAPGHVPLTTHLFVADSPYIDQDAVFGKRDSLVVDFEHARAGQGARRARDEHAVPLGELRLPPRAGAGLKAHQRHCTDSHEDRQGHGAAHRHLHVGRTHASSCAGTTSRSDLIGKISFVDHFFLLLTGQQPTPAQPRCSTPRWWRSPSTAWCPACRPRA